MKRWTSYPLMLAGMVCLLSSSLVVGCSGEKKEAQALPPPTVKVKALALQDVPLVFEYVGQTMGSRTVEVRSRVTGILRTRLYEEGQFVRAGQVLFEIEPDSYEAATEQARGMLAQSQADYDRSKREWERIQSLYSKNAVSQRDRDGAQAQFDAAKANVDAARAAVREASIQLGYTKVVAPISGITSLGARTEGNLISNQGQDGGLLTTVVQADPLYVNYSMPNADVMRLRRYQGQNRLGTAKEGITAQIRLLDDSLYERTGIVTFIDKSVSPLTGGVKARAEFVNPDYTVLPGQFARVIIKGNILKDALLVPQRAVLQTSMGAMMYTVDDKNVAKMGPVKLGDAIGDNFVVESGLKVGDRIITEGIIKVRPDQVVAIAPDKKPLPGLGKKKAAKAAPADAPKKDGDKSAADNAPAGKP